MYFIKIKRLANRASKIFRVFKKQGIKAAYYSRHEYRATTLQNWQLLEYSIRRRLNYLGIQSSGALKLFYQNCFIKDLRDLQYENFNQKESSDVLRMSRIDELAPLYTYFRYCGDFRIANLLRTNLLNKYVSRELTDGRLTNGGLSAALELGLPHLVFSSRLHSRQRYKNKGHVSEMIGMALAQIGKLESAGRIWQENFNEQDRLFLKYIQGKTIALVGPSVPDEDLGQEIESHDIVVRTNYRIGSNTPTKKFGLRTDIAYYNHSKIMFNLSEVIRASENIQWAVLKSPDDCVKFNRAVGKKQPKSRSLFAANEFFFDEFLTDLPYLNSTRPIASGPMSIQNAINDIVRFSPARLKLFSTTFYCSDKPYDVNYTKRDVDRKEISRDLRIHEPFSCFAFVKNCYCSGLIELDGGTYKVMSLDPEQYATRLQDLYGKEPLPS